MKKLLAVIMFLLAGVVGVSFALDTDTRWSSTGTTDEVGLWCRGTNSSGTAYTMPNGVYFNCTSGEVTLGQGIPTASIDDSAITSPKMASASVPTAAIIDANVTSVKLGASNVVYTAHIADSQITSVKLAASDVVYTARIAANQVTSVKLGASDVVYTAHVAASQITSPKMASSSIYGSTHIIDTSITSDKYGAFSIASGKFYDQGSSDQSGKVLCLKDNGGIGVCGGTLSAGISCESCR